MDKTSNQRGVTNLVGFVLLLGLVLAGAAIVSAVGGAALNQVQDEADADLAVKTFRNVDTGADSLRQFSTASSSQTGIPSELSGKMVLEQGGADVNVTITPPGSSTTCTTGDLAMGSMRYVRNGETVAVYEGGGIFEQTESGIVVRSQPDLNYRDARLQLWLFDFQDTRDASSHIGLTNDVAATRSTTQTVRNDLESCLSGASNGDGEPRVEVDVHSDYAEGWTRYFESAYPNQETTYWEENQTVRTVFDGPDATDTDADDGDGDGDSATLCAGDSDTEYRWNDFEHDGNETDLRFRCGEEDGDEMRIRYDMELENGSAITIKNNGSKRVLIAEDDGGDYVNNTRWRFNQSTRDLNELHDYDYRVEGVWQEYDNSSWTNGSDYDPDDVDKDWDQSMDEDEFPENLSMGPPDEIAGALLRKHPELTCDNLDDGSCEDLMERLRNGDTDGDEPTATADDNDNMAPSDHVQIRIFEVTAEESN